MEKKALRKRAKNRVFGPKLPAILAESGGHIDFGVFEISSKETPQLYIIVENIDIAFVECSRRGEKF